jgi:peptidyl-prolyl cis-trans isomerase C
MKGTLQMLKSLLGKRVVIGVVAGLLVTAGVVLGIVRHHQLPDDAVLRYHGRVVTQAQLEERLKILEALYGIKPPSGGDQLDDFHRDAAKSMAVTLVLADAVEDHHIEVTNKQAQTELDKLIDAQLTGGRQAFVQFLGSTGISEQDVLDEIRNQMTTSRLMAAITGKVPAATESDAQAEYDAHQADMHTPESRRIANVVVAARSDADAVARLARRGTPFAQLARTYSLDGSTRTKGGELGWVIASQLEDSFAKAAFAAQDGGVFGPVQTRFGWNVGTVEGVRAPQEVSFAQAEATIQDDLTTRARLDAWRSYLGRLLEDADVQYADDYRPADPAAPPSDTTPASDAPTAGTP